MKDKTLSLIIPAYNEEKTVGEVVAIALKTTDVSEVICINDGSTDKTLKILKAFGKKIDLINFDKNRGKGAALAAGIKTSKGEFVIFIDADLIGLKSYHIQQMYKKMLSGEYDMLLGIRDYSTFWFLLVSWLVFRRFSLYGRDIDEFAGERIYYRKDLRPHLEAINNLGFGVETYLNKAFKNKKVGFVKLKGVKHRPNHVKYGISYKMIKETISEYRSILNAR